MTRLTPIRNSRASNPRVAGSTPAKRTNFVEDDRHEDGFAARDDRAGTRVDACNLASGQEDAEHEEALLGTPAARSRDRHLRGGEFERLLEHAVGVPELPALGGPELVREPDPEALALEERLCDPA